MLHVVEGGFGFPLGGDPEDLLRGLREFAEQQAESVHEAQREQFATLTLNTAVELTAAALSQGRGTGERVTDAGAAAPPAGGPCTSSPRPATRPSYESRWGSRTSAAATVGVR